jgi:hypothetical protein
MIMRKLTSDKQPHYIITVRDYHVTVVETKQLHICLLHNTEIMFHAVIFKLFKMKMFFNTEYNLVQPWVGKPF